MNLFAKHVPFATLVDLAEGLLEDGERAQAEAHLAHCEHCRAAWSSVQRITAAFHSDELLEPPAYVTARAIQSFRPLARPLADGRPQRRSLLALLQFDSGLTPALGLRSGEAEARQWLFHVEDYDIALRLEPSGGRWLLAGQLLGGGPAGTAELIGDASYAGEINELGEFSFADVVAGAYQLTIALENVDITLPPLGIGV